MLRLAALSVAVVGAFAQDLPSPLSAEVTANSDGLRLRAPRNQDVYVERVQRTNIAEVETRLEAIETNYARATDARDIAYNATLSATATTFAAIQGLAATVSDSLAAMNANVATIESRLENAQSTQMSTMARDMSIQMSAMTSSMESSLVRSAAESDALSTRITASLSTAGVERTVAITAMNSTMIRAVSAKRDKKSNMFSAYKNSNHGSGWFDYPFEVVEVDTLAPYARKSSRTRITATQPFHFSASIHQLKQSCNWAHNAIYVNGQHRGYSQRYRWNPWHGSHWSDDDLSLTSVVGANQIIYWRGYTTCWSQHGNYYHSRVGLVVMGSVA